MTHAANYSAGTIAVDGQTVVRLHDAAAQTEVLIAPSMGNNAYSMKVKGQQVMWAASPTLAEWKAKLTLVGNPFLWPWANRILGESYWANGKKYQLNTAIGNVRKDGNGNPIHGLLAYSDAWEVVETAGGDDAASVASRLEYWRYPEWLAQFPFAHGVTMRYRLKDGALEVETVLDNLSDRPMPVSLGYHPYFQLTDSGRDDWKVHLAARSHVSLSNALTPTGETKPVTKADPHALRGSQLDDVFTDLIRDKDGRAVFSVTGKSQKLEVLYGPNYPVAVVYAPPGRGFICFEPMAGVTDVFNLAHAGKFPLQSVPARGQWRESFWIRPSGF